MVHRHHVVSATTQGGLLALVLELVGGEANGIQLVAADGISRVAGEHVLLVAQHHRTDLVVRAAAGAVHTAAVLQLRLLVDIGVVSVVKIRAAVSQTGSKAGTLLTLLVLRVHIGTKARAAIRREHPRLLRDATGQLFVLLWRPGLRHACSDVGVGSIVRRVDKVADPVHQTAAVSQTGCLLTCV